MAVGHFELKLLAAIRSLSQQAWGSKLQNMLSEILGRDVAIGQLYLALSRLEQKGFISASKTVPEPRQGGRSKKVFRLEAPGVKVLEEMAALLNDSGAPLLAMESANECKTCTA